MMGYCAVHGSYVMGTVAQCPQCVTQLVPANAAIPPVVPRFVSFTAANPMPVCPYPSGESLGGG